METLVAMGRRSGKSLRSLAIRSKEPRAIFLMTWLPILKANCFSCHGDARKVKGGLRLTSRDLVLRGGASGGPAVSQGKLDQSLLLKAINYQDLKMPPRGRLPQGQIDILTRWVKMG